MGVSCQDISHPGHLLLGLKCTCNDQPTVMFREVKLELTIHFPFNQFHLALLKIDKFVFGWPITP